MKYVAIWIMIFVAIFIILLISVIIHIILIYSDYKRVYCMKNQLLIWVSNGCKGHGPNGYEFKQLFKRAFPGMIGDKDTIITQFHPLIREETVNTVDCFPSNNKELVRRHFALLNHMCDIFSYKYKQNYDPIYWLRMFIYAVKFIVFLPGKVFNYLGSNSTKIEKFANAVWWIMWITPIFVKFIKNLL